MVLENTAREPEICSLCEMLRDMGAKINGETTGTIHICGAGKLHGTEVTIPGDRIVFMTYAAMALGTQGKIRIRTEKESFLPERKELEKSGCFFAQDAEGVLAEGNQGIHPIPYLKTAPYPGFDRCTVTFPDTAFAGAWREYFVRDGYLKTVFK